MIVALRRGSVGVLLVVLLAAVGLSAGGPISLRAQGTGTAPAVSLGPQQVFALSGSQLLSLQQQCPALPGRMNGSTSCVVRAMRQAGATPEAIEFYRVTGHILTQFQEMGTVDLGTVVHDIWCCTADTSDMEPVLLGGTPAAVYPLEVAAAVDLSSYSGYSTAIAQFPNLAYRGLDGVTFEQLTASPEGGQRFIFDNALINGCQACGTGYSARLAFDFDADGGYLGTVPLDIACQGRSSSSGCTASS